jgi:hypothetical protein
LWHDTNVLLASSTKEATEEFLASARQLSEDLRPSRAYTLQELREYAVKLMREDVEFQRAVGRVDGLFDHLVEIVRSP